MQRSISLGTSHRYAASRLEDGAGVLKDILDGSADLIGRDQDHLVEILFAQTERFLANHAHRSAVSKQTNLVQLNTLASPQTLCHCARINSLHTNDADARTQSLYICGNTCHQTAA